MADHCRPIRAASSARRTPYPLSGVSGPLSLRIGRTPSFAPRQRRSQSQGDDAERIDLPAFAKLRDFKTWAEEGPPKGYAVQLPAASQRPQVEQLVAASQGCGPRCLDRLCAGPTAIASPAVFASDDDQDDRTVHATGRKHRS